VPRGFFLVFPPSGPPPPFDIQESRVVVGHPPSFPLNSPCTKFFYSRQTLFNQPIFVPCDFLFCRTFQLRKETGSTSCLFSCFCAPLFLSPTLIPPLSPTPKVFVIRFPVFSVLSQCAVHGLRKDAVSQSFPPPRL